ncbi:MAG: glycosyltransferase [Candidatus Odinarchaeia archaeon]
MNYRISVSLIILITIIMLSTLFGYISFTFNIIFFGWVIPFIFYFISIYNIFFLIKGVYRILKERRRVVKSNLKDEELPKVSIIVPVKNEEKVISRLLNRLIELYYPKDKLEIIIIEDGSTDNTVKICKEFAEKYNYIKFYNRKKSSGKPDALREGTQLANGEIIAVFDADNIPHRNVLRDAVVKLNSPKIAAVQGFLKTLNTSESPISEIADYEMKLNQLIASGKNDVNLFVQLYGTNQFIKKDYLQQIGSWDVKSLSEDQEISIRLAKAGYKIKMINTPSWQENPPTIKSFFKQRLRWYQGAFQNLFKHKDVIKKSNQTLLARFDLILCLFNPFFNILGTLSLLIGILLTFIQAPTIFTVEILLYAFIALNITIFTWAIALAVKTKQPRKILLAPYLYIYWFAIFTASLWALIKVLCKKTSNWEKTEKNGTITEAHS